jgi:hypothetical protein
MRRFIKQTLRAAGIAARDERIPRPIRWFAALGLLPIPGPIDEAILIVVAIPLAIFYSQPLREAWHRAGSAQLTH